MAAKKAASKKAAPAKKAAPKNSTGGDQPVRAGQKKAAGTKPAATSNERKAIIKQAQKVFGKGNYELVATEGGHMAAMSKKGGSKAMVYAYETPSAGITNPWRTKTTTRTALYGGSGGPASRKK
jgi:hypothetical protein